MSLKQVCIDDAPGVKIRLTVGEVRSWNIETKNPILKFFSETGGRRALIFGFEHLLMDLYQVVHMMLVGSKMASPRGHKLQHRNKEDQLQNSSSLKLEGLEL